MSSEDRRDQGESRFRLRVQSVPALDLEGLVSQQLEAGDAVHVRAHVVAPLQELLRAEDLPHDRARSEERDPAPAALLARAEEIDAADDPFLDALWHGRLRVVLVVEGEVV